MRQHLDLGKVAVLGHSYGGFIALEYALRYPGAVSHLILLDTAPAFDYGEEIINNAKARGATAAMLEELTTSTPAADEEVLKSSLKLILPLYFCRNQPADDALFAETIYCATCAGYQGQMLATYNVVPRLHEIGCPTLVLVSRDDFICPPSQAEVIHEHIPHSRLVVFEDSGHFPWIEEPEHFTQVVKTWVKQTSLRSG